MPRVSSVRSMIRSLRTSPYPRHFNTASASQKSNIVHNIHAIIDYMSGGQAQVAYNYLLRSKIGKQHLPSAHLSQKTYTILSRIKQLCHSVGNGSKANILSLVVGCFSRKCLKDQGFKFTSRQQNTALANVRKDHFTLNVYAPLPPRSQQTINNSTISLIYQSLLSHSRISNKIHSNGKEVYYLEKTKKYIYERLLEEHSDLKLSLSSFYKYCPKNFQKARKRTDMCPICVKGHKLQQTAKLLQTSGRHLSATMCEDLQLYHHHTTFKDWQKIAYDTAKNSVTNDSCIVVVDFKQNFKVGIGPEDTTIDFCKRAQVSLLGFAIVFKDIHGNQKTKYVNYFSHVLSHDSRFVTQCFQKLIESNYLQGFKTVSIFADNGRHFRSAECLHFVLREAPQLLNAQVFRNYFCPYHGKSIVDGHFGLLARWFSEGSSVSQISNITDLIALFNFKAISTGNTNIHCELYDSIVHHSDVVKLNISKMQLYSSFIFHNNTLFACPVSTHIYEYYVEIEWNITVAKERRKTKTASSSNMSIDLYEPLMGERAKSYTLSRAEIAQQIQGTWSQTS